MENRRLTRAKSIEDMARERKRSYLRWLAIVGALALAGTAAFLLVSLKVKQAIEAKWAAEARVRLEEVVTEGSYLFGGTTRQAIFNKMGEPERIDDSVVRDLKKRGSTWSQKIYRIHYPGLLIEVQRLQGKGGEPPEENLALVSVSSSAFRLKHGLAVGIPKAEVRRVLGAPDRGEPDKDIYETGGVMQRSLRFTYLGEVVTGIEWRY